MIESRWKKHIQKGGRILRYIVEFLVLSYLFSRKQLLKLAEKVISALISMRTRFRKTKTEELQTLITVVQDYVTKTLPSLGRLLEEAYLVIYNRDITVMIANNVRSLDYDSDEFRVLLVDFFNQFRVVCGDNIYRVLVKIWGDENKLQDYIALWFYERVISDLSTTVRTRLEPFIREGRG